MTERGLSRRRLLTAGAVVGAAPLAAANTFPGGQDEPFKQNAAAFPGPAKTGDDFAFFNPAEQTFIKAAVARLIPNDNLGPGALEAGVHIFIDRQLAGPFGQARDWYMQGPWAQGEKTQGYQSRMNPAGLYRAAIAAIGDATQSQFRKPFHQLSPGDQDAFLKNLEAGEAKLSGGVDGKGFFKLLMQNVIEGYFSDPLYGGNRGMGPWRMIGFAGARYDQRQYVKAYNQPYPLPPVGIYGRPEWERQG